MESAYNGVMTISLSEIVGGLFGWVLAVLVFRPLWFIGALFGWGFL